MEMTDLEQQEIKKTDEEVERFFKEYGIEENKNAEQTLLTSYPYFFYNEKFEETITIRLSNSTTPIACY
ncbi:hypothetical protein [Bacteroides mediterraneensis]|uniref:Uncharacterized protein n=1 Tax=Bacteroides mediterraneensis TaxID=1841856 RepID=A0ABS2EZ52_9BACE|nr:hypothetical protein [Bacteroides mediterraneensis]MBM6759836.1 hypothetical protein [Bacteroides mediterraneensis]